MAVLGSSGNAPDITQYVDQLESLLTNIGNYTDGLENLATLLNGYVDGLEGLLGGTLSTKLVPQTSGGLAIYRKLASADDNAAVIKNAACQLYGWYFMNLTAAVKYVKLYSKATAPTTADTPVMTIPLPASGGANLAIPHGLAFGTGLAIRITGGVADNDATVLAANDVVVNIWYYQGPAA